jgi:hypothetical protein
MTPLAIAELLSTNPVAVKAAVAGATVVDVTASAAAVATTGATVLTGAAVAAGAVDRWLDAPHPATTTAQARAARTHFMSSHRVEP